MASFYLAVLLIALTPCRLEAVEDIVRFDCYPDDGATQQLCEARGCAWEETQNPKAPKCFYWAPYGYRMDGNIRDTALGSSVTLRRLNTPARYVNSADVDPVTLDVEMHTAKRLRIKFYDGDNQRFEVRDKMPHIPAATGKAPSQEYIVSFRQSGPTSAFALRVTRTATRAALWDTSVGGLTFSDQFLQISTKLPSSYVYGFGEHERDNYRHNMDWRTWGMFTRDEAPGPPSNGVNKNLYGMHPFYLCVEDDGKAHGVLLLNSNAMEVALQPTPAMTFRTIGGVLDFYMFLGDGPEDVVRQYTEFVGRPFMPPYWGLGFQLCKWGYGSLDVVKDVVKEMQDFNIPHDVQYGDIDYMERQMDFTIDPVNYQGLPEFVDQIRRDGMRYVIILDPAITTNETEPYPPYTNGTELDVWIKNGDDTSQPLIGKVWPYYPGVTVDPDAEWDYKVENYNAYSVFPDYFHADIDRWWGNFIKDFYNTLKFDGLWIDMNEPTNFVHGSVNGCSNNKWDNPPYLPKILGPNIYSKTLCMNSEHGGTKHYNTHSLYGWSQAEPTQKALREVTGKRGIVFGRSTFPSAGHFEGHWLGDNTAKWDHLHKSIIGMLDFGLFGMPYVGADICGFWDDSTPDLCQRWMLLGAYYPFSRNHNWEGGSPQHPTHWDGAIADAARDSLQTRYTFLPYLYTLFYQAHTQGSTVVRSLMHEFIEDKHTWSIDRQFLWGPALLISPVLDQGAMDVTAYFPKARWYDYYSVNSERQGREVADAGQGRSLSLPCDMDCIPVHIRGGHVIPTQGHANTTVYSRRKPLGLIVALDEAGEASGSLFWDDGEDIDTVGSNSYRMITFSVTATTLDITVERDGYTPDPELHYETIQVFGSPAMPTDVTVNGQNAMDNIVKKTADKVWHLEGLSLSMAEDHKITWTLPDNNASGAEVSRARPVALLLAAMAVVLANVNGHVFT
ncbi:MGAM [Branchiostoma lanceolatum]|uniref:MGAM protein n=1 Tax=Branchiostoma lanceolatum TaxID=7740 RepID=A0A8K0A5M3_BRALA|nr:MGAM [Branchiostoma lanceolatum]